MTGKVGAWLAAALVSLSLAATPTVSDVIVSQGADRAVTISYTLDEDAIVTIDILVGGRPVGEKVLAGNLSGAVNRIVGKGAGNTVVWNADRVRLGLEATSLSAVVKAWDLACPPDYMVVQVGGGKEDIRFYTSTNALPDGGLDNRIYASDRIVFRKIPAAGVKWRKGITKTQSDLVGQVINGRNRPHYVTLTKDYYMAIYPLTQRQGAHYFGSSSRCTPTGLNAYGHPWNGYSFDEIRGKDKGALWPALEKSETEAHQVDEGSLMHNMRTQLGISTIDLPTQAQWEFACRAGTGTNFYNGEDSVTEAMTRRETLYCWSKGFASGQPQPVGLLAPNPWGLYDMTGNVYTWALDLVWDGNKSGADEIDPRGTDPRGGNLAAGSRFWLGGFVGNDAKNYNTTSTTCISGSTTGRIEVGVRLVCSADMSELK